MGLLSSSKSKSGAAEAGSSQGVQGQLQGSTNPVNVQDTVSINLSAGDDLGSNRITINKTDLGAVNRSFAFADNALNAVRESATITSDKLSDLTEATLDSIARQSGQGLDKSVLLLAAAAIFAPVIARGIK